MYIIDNDGLANSDKRFLTKLRNNKNGWKHDEISGWVNTEGEEKEGILEERWMKYDDYENFTKWKDEEGITKKIRKATFLSIDKVINNKYYILLPEYYLRSYEPNYIDSEELEKEVEEIEKLIKPLK